MQGEMPGIFGQIISSLANFEMKVSTGSKYKSCSCHTFFVVRARIALARSKWHSKHVGSVQLIAFTLHSVLEDPRTAKQFFLRRLAGKQKQKKSNQLQQAHFPKKFLITSPIFSPSTKKPSCPNGESISW